MSVPLKRPSVGTGTLTFRGNSEELGYWRMGCSPSVSRSAIHPTDAVRRPSVAAAFLAKLSRDRGLECLEAMLRNAVASRHFRAFLARSYDVNALDFIDAVDGLLREKNSPRKNLAQKALEIHDLYVRAGAARALPLPDHLRPPQDASRGGRTLGGTPDYEGLLRLAKKEMLFVLSCDAYPRFCASSNYAALLTELSSIPSARADAILRPLTDSDSDSDTLTTAVAEDVVSLALPPPVPLTWLARFIRMADMLPVCITLADATKHGFPLVYCNETFLALTGYSWDEVRGRNCRFVQGARTDPEAIAVIRKAIANQQAARVSLINYSKTGRLFRNLLALRPVFEYASEADAAADRDGIYRYVIGVQHVGPLVRVAETASELDARLVELDSLVQLLPATIIAPPVTSRSGADSVNASKG